ncbi:aluminum-activated malate transporter 2-like [Argentina anserina]|uniref:aluminum-activated malate transporter 2-like n=1 Tax=Argentina anserina TaxID=57926 RepID=UPI0021765999|nr:aluminum-activated malate transporter 2-like [Potentilla anserina]
MASQVVGVKNISEAGNAHNDHGFCGRMMNKVVEFPMKLKKLGQDDPRRIVHSLKVGLAVLLVTLLYYLDPLYDGLGATAMWAVLTVVVVFEFSVGATLGRGLNRILATFLAGSLGFGVHHLANLSGEKGHPILVGGFVFLLAALVTFFRFFPRIKARYDYGLLIFILTFCMISVSGYRDDEILEMAHKRVSTILIGAFTAVSVCVFIRPVWAGDDLHNSVATNIEKLGSFLEEFGSSCFKKPCHGRESNMTLLKGYSSVLNTKQSEESQVNFARWEPRHGRFRFRHPWKHYLKIGSLTRQCAYRLDTLNGYINSDIQKPLTIKNSKVQELCMKLSSELSKGLKEQAFSMKVMTRPTSAHITKSRAAANTLKSFLKSPDLGEDIHLLDIIPAVTVASLLTDVVSYVEKIEKSIQELASLSHVRFKSAEPNKEQEQSEQTKLHKHGIVHPCADKNDGPHHVISIVQLQPSLKEIA